MEIVGICACWSLESVRFPARLCRANFENAIGVVSVARGRAGDSHLKAESIRFPLARVHASSHRRSRRVSPSGPTVRCPGCLGSRLAHPVAAFVFLRFSAVPDWLSR